jgi:Uma2 family endonuclease
MQTQVKWSVDDYHRMIEAGILADRQVELLNGEICSMVPEGIPHTYCGISLSKRFEQKLGDRAEVRQARPITLSSSEPEPDIAIVKGTFEDYRYRQPSAADVLLIVEISETSLAKDLKLKRATYAAAGIADYWIIDLNKPQLIVFRNLQDGDYQFEERLQQGSISPLAFPDISMSVAQLLA